MDRIGNLYLVQGDLVLYPAITEQEIFDGIRKPLKLIRLSEPLTQNDDEPTQTQPGA
jgi:hypothetical protein